ncbi:MAG: hypothetical protein AAF360_16940, partial [Pseudomonadota bacterium]
MRSKHVAISLAALATSVAPQAIAQSPAVDALPGLEGRAIVSIHDGDMLASAYINGRLGPRESADALSVLSLEDLSFATAPVSNSVAGAPTAVAVTPDGRYAVVSESFGPRPADGEGFRDLPIGENVTLIDLSDLSAPRVVDTAAIGERLDGLSLSPDGDIVAVALHQNDGRGVAFVAIDDDAFG